MFRATDFCRAQPPCRSDVAGLVFRRLAQCSDGLPSRIRHPWRSLLSSQFPSESNKLAARLAPRHARNSPALRCARRFRRKRSCSGGYAARKTNGCADVDDGAPLRRDAHRPHVKSAEAAENCASACTFERSVPQRSRRPRSLPSKPVEPANGFAFLPQCYFIVTCAAHSIRSPRRCRVRAVPADARVPSAELTVYFDAFVVRAGARYIYCKWVCCTEARGAVCGARTLCVRCNPACSATAGRTPSISSVYVYGAARGACVRCGQARSAPAGGFPKSQLLPARSALWLIPQHPFKPCSLNSLFPLQRNPPCLLNPPFKSERYPQCSINPPLNLESNPPCSLNPLGV